MKKLYKTALCLLAAVWMSVPLTTGGTEVIAHREVVETGVQRTTVRAIFMGNITRWGNGRPIVVVVLPADHPTTKSFAWDILHMTPYAFEERISSMVATRDGNPPRVVSSEQEMLRVVASTPNSVGYLSSMIVINNANTTFRVIPVL
jgi:ABC-type phosphate transport system substrate-binding protein